MFTFRLATQDDAEQIAEIVYATSEGVVHHLLDNLIPGLDGTRILASAFMQGEGPYTTDNGILSERNDHIISLLISYPASEHGVPGLMESFISPKRLNAVRPILEKAVPNSLYINTIWVTESLQRSGIGSALMIEAESRCRSLGFNRISLFCWNDNERALRFYARQGFAIVEHLPQEILPLEGHASGGSLLCKTLGAG